MKYAFTSTLSVLMFLANPIYSASLTDATQFSKVSLSQTKQIRDGHIIAWFIALNQNEIDASKVALNKSQNPEVKKFAELMINQHTQNLNTVVALSKKLNIKPIDNAQVISLKKEGKNEHKKLKALNSNSIDEIYIKAMVKGHMSALQKINILIKSVNNNELLTYVNDTRQHVKMHLEKAKLIQMNMKTTRG